MKSYPGLPFIFKTLERPAYLYQGQLIFARNDVEIFISVVCRELVTTGAREAVATSELIAQGRLTSRNASASLRATRMIRAMTEWIGLSCGS